MSAKKPILPSGGTDGRELPAAALRAIEEARQRREAEAARSATTEVDGPKGPEPTRYGDWERNGLASDF